MRTRRCGGRGPAIRAGDARWQGSASHRRSGRHPRAPKTADPRGMGPAGSPRLRGASRRGRVSLLGGTKGTHPWVFFLRLSPALVFRFAPRKSSGPCARRAALPPKEITQQTWVKARLVSLLNEKRFAFDSPTGKQLPFQLGVSLRVGRFTVCEKLPAMQLGCEVFLLGVCSPLSRAQIISVYAKRSLQGRGGISRIRFWIKSPKSSRPKAKKALISALPSYFFVRELWLCQ